MEPHRVERKLAAILSADVKGYSRLMGADEVGTLHTLTAYRELIDTLIRQHRGRVVGTAGDSVLAEFASVVDAVQGAVVIQTTLKAENANLPPECRMEFRIGINVGDVVVEGEQIYGDGVNVAARLQGLAAAGGILISGTVYDQIENKLALNYEYLGEQIVKNIAKPVRVYRVVLDEAAVPSVGARRRRAPTIGLPSRRVGTAHRAWVVVAGLVLIAGVLVTVRYLSSPSTIRNPQSTIRNQEMLPLPDKPYPKYAEAYAALGSTYFLKSLWRWSPDPQLPERALELAQKAIALDDSSPPAHTLLSWVYMQKQQYDQASAEGERAIALDPNSAGSYWTQADVLNAAGRPQEALWLVERVMRLNPHYPATYLMSLGFAYRATGRYAEAIAVLKEAISRSPNLMPAHMLLALSHLLQWTDQLSQDPQTLAQALAAAQRVIALNDASPWGHMALGIVYLWQKQYEQALTEMERAVALDPNWASGSASLAEVLSRVGRPKEALRLAEQALRLGLPPYVVDSYLESLGSAYYLIGRPEEALAPLKEFLTRFPNRLAAYLTLAVVYSELGQEAEAQAEAAEVLRINPQFSLEVHKQRVPIKDPAVLERHLAALRKAGLK